MRILYIASLYHPFALGGAEHVLKMQVHAMHNAGHDVAVLSLGRNPGLSRENIDGITVWRAGIENCYFHFDELRERRAGRLLHMMWHGRDVYNTNVGKHIATVVDEFSPDVASCHNLPGWSIAIWDALKSCRVPIVQVLHDQYLLCPASTMYSGTSRCSTQCLHCRTLRWPHRRKSTVIDTVVGVSQFICDKHRAYGYFRGVRCVKAIPNILPPSCEAVPRRITPGSIVFGYLGRLSADKGVELMLDAFSQCANTGWRLKIAGRGEAAYEARLKSRYNTASVEFCGTMDRRDFFPQIAFTILPSLWEDTLPSVAYESIIYRVPVIGSRIGGIPEIVGANNGVLFAPGDATDLIRAMHEAVATRDTLPGGADDMGDAECRFRDEEKWMEEWTRVYIDAYEATARRKAPP